MKNAALFVVASPILIPAIAVCLVVVTPIVIRYMVWPSIKSSYIP
jgi:hypothetical protein